MRTALQLLGRSRWASCSISQNAQWLASTERRDAATDTRNCGSGLALGLTSNSSDGMTTLNGGVSFDRIGGQDRRAIQLQAEMRF